MVCGEEEGTVFATILLYSGSVNIVPQKILQEMFDVMPGSVAIYDSEDRLMFANTQFVDYFLENGLNSPFGSTFSELQMTCKNAGWYDRASPDPDSYSKLRLKAHEDCNGIFLQETPSGTFERIEEFRLPCGGRFTVYTDVTQHALESHDARERDQAKTDFLSVMSHEVRTPLVGLIGMLDMLEEADTRSERHRIETVMRKSGEQLMSIVDSILDLSKMDHGKLILEERPFSPVDTLAPILDQYRLAAEAKGLETVVKMDGPIYEKLGDPIRFGQIIEHLLSNAVKFTEQGQISLRLGRNDCGYLEVSVSDTGVGIDPEALSKLFEPFEQADLKHDRTYGGAGLGLAFAAKLTKLFGGTISCSSKLGEGSTMTVVLPLKTVPSQQETATPQHALSTLDYTGQRAMIADDNDINRDILQAFLAKLGFQVDVAENGLSAVKLAETTDYDAILLDISMPDIDGTEVLRRIRTMPRHDHVPAIAVTANVLKADIERFVEAGFVEVVKKPFSRVELAAALKRAGVAVRSFALT